MRVVGFIVEYNPFHNGHLWHLREARRLANANYSIAIMSGNFVQRGEPAFFDKWTRAEMAVSAGVDLVMELPLAFAVRSAQYFAAGGIRLLSALGIVNNVCFGAEHADLALLNEAAEILANNNIQNEIRSSLKNGGTYATALSSILERRSSLTGRMLSSPNNILAIEYLRSIKNYSPELAPIVIKRRGADYNDQVITGKIASATAIRQTITSAPSLSSQVLEAVPPAISNIIQDKISCGQGPIRFDNYSQLLLAKLRLASEIELSELPDMGEGLHYKLQAAALKATTIEELIRLLKSKRYTWTRLQRILVHALLGTNKQNLAKYDELGPLYARVLAFNDKGRELLKAIQFTTKVPVITKTTTHLNSKDRTFNTLTPVQKMLALDTTSTDIYVLGMPNRCYHTGGWDFSLSPRYLKQPLHQTAL